jgi:hypothetical protein
MGKITIKNSDFDENEYVINLTGTVEDIIEKILPDEEASKNSNIKKPATPKSINAISSAYPNPTHA